MIQSFFGAVMAALGIIAVFGLLASYNAVKPPAPDRIEVTPQKRF
jgi:hypothetical protein